jgi:hypothetical protein
VVVFHEKQRTLTHNPNRSKWHFAVLR